MHPSYYVLDYRAISIILARLSLSFQTPVVAPALPEPSLFIESRHGWNITIKLPIQSVHAEPCGNRSAPPIFSSMRFHPFTQSLFINHNH